MNLSISNIAWVAENDKIVYEMMRELGYSGLEIAPTRILPERPYEKLDEARNWANCIRKGYGFDVPSMQSIWYGRSEKIFGSEEEKEALTEYTKKAIDFAEAVGCTNLVFGCPRNRSIPDDVKTEVSIPFFRGIGDYAFAHNCVIALEANPPIYNTNFINTTVQALDLIKMVDSKGFRLNLDVGAMVENGEKTSLLKGNEKYIHHVHVSEPGLRSIVKRNLHEELACLLREADYKGYVSIEAGRQDDLTLCLSMMKYVKEIFG